MGWRVDEDELLRVRALDVDARYAYAINKASEQGELWTLASDDGWVVSTNPDGVSMIPVWPHERFAAFEATGEWADAIPERVALADEWLIRSRCVVRGKSSSRHRIPGRDIVDVRRLLRPGRPSAW